MLKKKLNLCFMSLILITVLISSCAKKRQDIEPQGQEGLIPISSYDNKEFNLTTQNKISDISVSKAKLIKNKNQNEMGLVSFSTSAALVKGLDIVAKAETNNYKIRYMLTDIYLIAYKIAKASDIPLEERTSASIVDSKGNIVKQKINKIINDNDTLAVPLVGYPVSYFTKDRANNGSGEKTNHIIYLPQTKKSGATHFKYNINNRIVFQKIKKDDVFPATYFLSSDWYFAATIISVNTKQHEPYNSGHPVTDELGPSPLSRMRFEPGSDFLRGINLNIDKAEDTTDPINNRSSIIFRAKWVDYRRADDGINEKLNEEEIGDGHPDKRDFSKRKFVKIDFQSIQSVITKYYGGQEVLDTELEEINFNDNSINFKVLYLKSGMRVMYSFKRAPSLKEITNEKHSNFYKPRILFNDDREIFGYYWNELDHNFSYRFYRDRDFEKKTLLTRFNPNKNIVYHFSKSTPRTNDPNSQKAKRYKEFYGDIDIRDIGRNAVKAWNEALGKAGLKISMELKEDFDVDLGNLNYNVININDKPFEQHGLGGYGPSISDSATGEIISATSNMYLVTYRNSIVSLLRQYVLTKLGILDKTAVFAPGFLSQSKGFNNIAPAIPSNISKNQIESYLKSNVGISLNEYSTLKKIQNSPSKYKAILNTLKSSKQISDLKKRQEIIDSIKIANFAKSLEKISIDNINFTYKNNIRKCNRPLSFATSYENIMKEVETNPKCVNVKIYTKDLQEANKKYYNLNIDTKKELSAFKDCLNSLIIKNATSSLVHEIGHNLGLTHNFHGSNDKTNFTKDDNGNVLYESSSIMEYSPNNANETEIPGPYDIAAIRFAYNPTEQIELAERNKFIKLDENKSISENLKDQGAEMHKYKFCWNVDENRIDPMCAAFDIGTTPTEIVTNTIEQYNSSLSYGRYNLGRGAEYWDKFANGVKKFQNTHFDMKYYTFLQLKKFYDHSRFLLKKYLERTGNYNLLEANSLARMSQEKIDGLFNEAENDPTLGKDIKEYRKAGMLVFDFLKNVLTLPTKYCIVNTKKSQKFVEFNQLRNEVFHKYVSKLGRKESSIFSCFDKLSKKYLMEEKDGSTPTGEFGYNYSDLSPDPSDKSLIYEPYEVVGVSTDRHAAAIALTTRFSIMLSHQVSDAGEFAPNFLDEPRFRKKIRNWLTSRISNGIDTNRKVKELSNGKVVSIKSLISNPNEKPFIEDFRTEQSLLTATYFLFKEGLKVPDDIDETIIRTSPYKSFMGISSRDLPMGINDESDLISETKITKVGEYIIQAPNKGTARDFVVKRNEILELRKTHKLRKEIEEHNISLKEFKSFIFDKEKVRYQLDKKEVIDKNTFPGKSIAGGADAKFRNFPYKSHKNKFYVFQYAELMNGLAKGYINFRDRIKKEDKEEVRKIKEDILAYIFGDHLEIYASIIEQEKYTDPSFITIAKIKIVIAEIIAFTEAIKRMKVDKDFAKQVKSQGLTEDHFNKKIDRHYTYLDAPVNKFLKTMGMSFHFDYTYEKVNERINNLFHGNEKLEHYLNNTKEFQTQGNILINALI